MAHLHQIPPVRAQGTLRKKRQKAVMARRDGGHIEIRPSFHQHDQSPQELTESEAARTGPAQVSTGPLHT